ncbi:hypothetical protein U27_06846 [Candidatus Vecturithrix granuli]|uniref:Uncharacterized protein n=1 Tax=Vecturithrix granuli TaxID=1499967 RepID=A0A081C5K5_VECG1|nr:hypothetical protein U27_06846 [Candidatus Vecturithrix granuli]
MSQQWHAYHVNRVLVPKQKGTKKFLRRYGEWLVCIRYRDDVEGQRKITTVEIVVEKRPWDPVPQRILGETCLPLRVEYGEVEIGKAVRAGGGEWYPQQKVWKLACKEIVALGLTDRIVAENMTITAGTQLAR